MAVTMKNAIFCDVTPCGSIKKNLHFGEHIAHLSTDTLKMEAICFSETSVLFTSSTRGHIPKDNILLLLRQ
jgi:hypothetical protein